MSVKIRLLTFIGHVFYACNLQVCAPAGQDFMLSALIPLLLHYRYG